MRSRGRLEEPFAVVGVKVFDGNAFLDDQTVTVDGGRIAGLGPRDAVEISPGDTRVEGSGRTLMPGFIDCHVHLGLHDPQKVLSGGVTTARDLGWPSSKIFGLVGKLRSDTESGPYLLAAGPMITASGGYPTRASWAPSGTGVEVQDPIEAMHVVDVLVAAGASVIKVAQEPRQGPVMSLETLTAVVSRAHGSDLKVTSHLGSLAQLEVALDAGVDELAHGLWSDEVIPDQTIGRMVDAGMAVIPTLHIDPSSQRIKNLARFIAGGGLVLYGTDMGNSGPPPGIDLKELELMMQAGMTLPEVLAAGTCKAARYLGLKGRGRVEVGAIADLVLLKGDLTAGLGPLKSPIWARRGKES